MGLELKDVLFWLILYSSYFGCSFQKSDHKVDSTSTRVMEFQAFLKEEAA